MPLRSLRWIRPSAGGSWARADGATAAVAVAAAVVLMNARRFISYGAVMTLPLLPWGWEQLSTASASAWGAALYLALVPSALGFVLWGYAVANLPMATSTSLLYLVPAVAVLIAFVWLGEVPHASDLLGGLVVIAGVVLVGQGDRLHAQRKRPALAPAST